MPHQENASRKCRKEESCYQNSNRVKLLGFQIGTESERSIEISRHINRSHDCIKKFLAIDGDYNHGGGPSKKTE